jgi:hypothetical protein
MTSSSQIQEILFAQEIEVGPDPVDLFRSNLAGPVSRFQGWPKVLYEFIKPTSALNISDNKSDEFGIYIPAEMITRMQPVQISETQMVQYLWTNGPVINVRVSATLVNGDTGRC